MTPRARAVLTGYPSWVNDSTTGGMTIKWMALSKSRNSTGNAVRTIPAQDLLGCMEVPPLNNHLNNHPPFYHATPPVGSSVIVRPAGRLKDAKRPIHISLSLGRG